MTLTLGELACCGSPTGLGDHLRVGPQSIPPGASSGVAIVQRGPHGRMISPPPPPGVLRWWGEDESLLPGPWTPQQRVIGVMGMGGSVEPDNATKGALSKAASALFDAALAAQRDGQTNVAIALRSDIQATLANLNGFAPFEASGLLSWGSWASSQTIRSQLQQALVNVDIATGSTSSGAPVSWTPQNEKFQPVSIARETAANLPGEVKDQVSSGAWGDNLAAYGKQVAKYALIAGGIYVGATVGVPLLQGWAQKKKRSQNPQRRARCGRARRSR